MYLCILIHFCGSGAVSSSLYVHVGISFPDFTAKNGQPPVHHNVPPEAVTGASNRKNDEHCKGRFGVVPPVEGAAEHHHD